MNKWQTALDVLCNIPTAKQTAYYLLLNGLPIKLTHHMFFSLYHTPIKSAVT